MTTKHTPGPWRAFEHSWCDTSIVADGFDHGICSLDINHATEESQEADAALMAANARLIAAAPDLLESLHEIRALAHDDIADPDDRAVRGRIVAMARDAIKKATGA